MKIRREATREFGLLFTVQWLLFSELCNWSKGIMGTPNPANKIAVMLITYADNTMDVFIDRTSREKPTFFNN